jgi:hypothetical protein
LCHTPETVVQIKKHFKKQYRKQATIPKNWSILLLPLLSTNVIKHFNGREKLNKKLSKVCQKQMFVSVPVKPEQT